MWFDSWSDIVRVLVVGSAAYLTLILILRVSGKRTLAKLNAFDLVITVAFGSTLATILLSKDVSWMEGVVALLALTMLQLVVSLVTFYVPGARSVITARPTLLMHEGELLEDAMRRQRLSANEVRQAVRASGGGDLSSVAAVVLETDGSLSVISTGQRGDGSAMADVTGWEGPHRSG